MNTGNSNHRTALHVCAYLLIAWSLVYGLFHLYWLLGGDGYPFHNKENQLFEAIVTYLPPKLGGWLFVILCSLGFLAGWGMKSGRRNIPVWMILTYLWGAATLLILFVLDASLIGSMAYMFLFKFAISWRMVNQVICIVGALVFAFAALVYQRKLRKACEWCGRINSEDKTLFLVRWGRWAAYIAALAPLPYAVTRFAWALGIPIGVERDFLQNFSVMNPMHHITEWIFGTLCLCGGLLTLGLIQKWGERFPVWFPFIGGQRVPVLLAVIPAVSVAIAVTGAGMVFTSSFIVNHLGVVTDDNPLLGQAWGAFGPMLTWIPWGVALGLAAIAYYYRRRSLCSHCGRGGQPL